MLPKTYQILLDKMKMDYEKVTKKMDLPDFIFLAKKYYEKMGPREKQIFLNSFLYE